MFDVEHIRNVVNTCFAESRDCWVQKLKKREPDFYRYVVSHYEGKLISEKIFLFLDQRGFIPITCGCGAKIKYHGIMDGYGRELCRKCSANHPNRNIQVKKTLQEKYDVDKINDIPSYREKRKALFEDKEWVASYGRKLKNGKVKKGIIVPDHQRDAYSLYCLVVRRLTNKQPIHLLDGYNKDKIGRDKGKLQVDHIFSKFEGFRNNIPPYIIADIRNLRVISTSENASKAARCDITKEQLLDNFYKE